LVVRRKDNRPHLVDTQHHAAILDATGLAFVIYDFRHSFATQFYEDTHDMESLRKVLGHSNLRSIMKYVHVSQDHVDGAMKIFEAAQLQRHEQRTEPAKPERVN
jgi:site-specific recombinase XerD